MSGLAELEAAPPGDGWVRVDSGIEPTRREWIRCVDFKMGKWERCCTYLTDPIIEANKRSQANKLNAKWGDGDVVASFPLDFYFREIVPARNNGDTKHIKKIINDADYSKFRTRGGRV